MQDQARVVVIGGGIIGCSVLYHLTKKGWSDVLLLERSELTAGSTWHAAASMHRYHDNPNIARLQAYSQDLYKSLETETGQSCGIHECGGIYLASSQDRMDDLRIQHARARYLGFDFELLGADDIRRLNPLVNTDGLHGGMYDPLDGHVDPSGVPNALAIGARQGGAKIHRHTTVTALEPRADGTWTVRTNRGGIHAEHVVNCAGLWAREVGALTGLKLPLQPMEHQYLVTEDIPELQSLGFEMPLTRDYDKEFYLRQEVGGLLIGAYERDGRAWAIDGTPPEFGMELLADDVERMMPNLEQAMERLPCFAEAGLKRVVNGPMIFSTDGLPLLGPVPGQRGMHVAVGVMAGFSQGGGIGKVMADWIVEGDPGMDLSVLDNARFGLYATREYTVSRVVESYSNRFAIHYPGEERPAGRPHATTPMYDEYTEMGAVTGFTYGFERPLWFAPQGVEAKDELSFRRTNWFEHVGNECRTLREKAGLIDLSIYGKLLVEGPDAEAFLRHVFCGRIPKNTGRMALVPMLNDRGGIIGDYTVAKVDDNSFYLVGALGAERMHMRWFDDHRGEFNVAYRSVAAEYGVYGLAGPNSRVILQQLTREDLSTGNFPFFRVKDVEIAGVPARLMRVSFTGDLGYEIHFPIQYQRKMFHALRDAGRPYGLGLAASRALDSLRLEKSYPRWGLELTADTNPFEAAMDGLIDWDRDFVGKQAVLASREKPLKWQICTLNVDAAYADALGNEPVLIDGEVAGVVTSGGYSHTYRQSVALAYLRPECCTPGREVEVVILGENRLAKISAQCLFDPEGQRLRA
ncbi:FAD-dependent oxidoreductase [Hoeflea sp. TYP-13]|uniref:FAD-dependent oxidoreductase n=1 Tax=Hoeflea sp. TYP-13 TaxID=3230023 RepID=UPI0034C6CC21